MRSLHNNYDDAIFLTTIFQSFCSALSQELTEYYRLIAVLEAQQSQGESSLTLRRLAVWTHDPLERMKMLGILVDGCKRKQYHRLGYFRNYLLHISDLYM